jgi:hypothetical protein
VKVHESIDCAEALRALCYQQRRSTAGIAVREDEDEDEDDMLTVCWKFTEALALARRRTASDRRDKIFGLLGLFPSRLSHEIAVTYKSSTREVFLTTALYLIEATKSFALFGFLGDSVPINPSWYRSMTADTRLSTKRAFAEYRNGCSLLVVIKAGCSAGQDLTDFA